MATREEKATFPDLFAGMVASMVGKHGQMDIRIEKMALTMPGWPLALEVNGKVSVALHLRDLSEEERKAHVASNLASIRH